MRAAGHVEHEMRPVWPTCHWSGSAAQMSGVVELRESEKRLGGLRGSCLGCRRHVGLWLEVGDGLVR